MALNILKNDDTPEARALRARIGTLFERSEGTMN